MEWTDYFDKLTRVDLLSASDKNKEHDFEGLYAGSGLSILDEIMESNFEECDVFIDLSFLAGAIGNDGVPYFLFFNNRNNLLDKDRLEARIDSIYSEMRGLNLGPFYHEEFFLKRREFGFDSFISEQCDDLEINFKENNTPFLSDGNFKHILNRSLSEAGYNKIITEIKERSIPPGKEEVHRRVTNFHSLLKKYCTHGGRHSCLLSLPIIGAPKPNQLISEISPGILHGHGAVFVFLISKGRIHISESVMHRLSLAVKDVSYNYVIYQAEQLVLESKKNIEKATIAGIMARNLSHNFGSHVLGNKSLYQNFGFEKLRNEYGKKEDSIQQKNLVKFHHYLQARLDFISRVISNAPTQLEALFFFTDLLDKFMIQEALLNTIAVDSGYGRDNFHLQVIVDGRKYTFKRNTTNYFVGEDNKEPEDFLIAIPGGMTGCQAFYSILENQIRNAVKYGEKKSKLIVTIEVSKSDEGLWNEIVIYENLSRPKVAEKMNEELQKEFIDMKTSHSGLIEIKTCAEFLSQRECNSIECIEHQGRLAYRFSISRPILIAKIILNGQATTNGEIKEITEFDELSDFTTTGSYFSLIVENELIGSERRNSIIRFIQDNHFKLPYRLLIFAASADSKSDWEALLQDSSVPFNRVKVVVENGFIHNYLEDRDKRFQDVVNVLYEIWIRSFKPLEGGNKYNLLIGLENDIGNYEVVMRHWRSEVIDVIVTKSLSSSTSHHSSDSLIPTYRNLKTQKADPSLLSRTIVFDNHGRVFKAYFRRHNRPLFSQKIGGTNNELYQELQNPPQNPDNFKFFIYSLVEAALLNVLVIDERVLSAYLTETADTRHELNNAGLHVIDSINEHPILGNHSPTNDLQIKGKHERPSVTGRGTFHYDAVIFHHGKFEELFRAGVLSYEDLLSFYTIAPVFIWTSGRGYDLERTNSGVMSSQFMDFSELNYSTYLSFNKFDLGKSILSKYGKEDI